MNGFRKTLSKIREERVSGIVILDKWASLSRHLNEKKVFPVRGLARAMTLGQESVGEIREMQEGERDWKKESKERVGRGCSSQDCLDSNPTQWEAMGMFEHRQ